MKSNWRQKLNWSAPIYEATDESMQSFLNSIVEEVYKSVRASGINITRAKVGVYLRQYLDAIAQDMQEDSNYTNLYYAAVDGVDTLKNNTIETIVDQIKDDQ